MELEELEGWAASFAAFCARFDDLFSRSESRTQAHKYLRGLLAGLERKTTWQLAEVVKDSTPDRMQRLLYQVSCVGIHKQYCGALGKIENCQVAPLLTYATAREHVFLCGGGDRGRDRLG